MSENLKQKLGAQEGLKGKAQLEVVDRRHLKIFKKHFLRLLKDHVTLT
jgi:hypothetical protein